MSEIIVYNFLDGKNICNIFAKLIVNEINSITPESKVNIQVVNVRTFFIVRGVSSSGTVLNLSEIFQKFLKKYDEDLSKKIRVIDNIIYNHNFDLIPIHITNHDKKLINLKKDKIQKIIDVYAKNKIYFNVKIEEVNEYLYYDCIEEELSTVIKILKTHFPKYELIRSDFSHEVYVSDKFHGLSNNGEKLYYFLLKYITNHIFKLGISKEMELSLYSNINVNDIDNNNCKFEILNNNHIVKTEWLRSLILDVFPFEYSKLVSKFGNFNYSDLDLSDMSSEDLIWEDLDLISEIVLV